MDGNGRDRDKNPNRVGERPTLDEIKRMRREHPSGWLELAMTPARALLVDAILDSPPGHEFTTGTISERAGITPQAVRDHLDVLVDRGVVASVDGTTYRIVDDSVVLRELEKLNAAVGAVRAGVADERLGGTDPDERADNAGDTGSIPAGRAERPTPNRSVSNAD
jgi:hypothetical protein